MPHLRIDSTGDARSTGEARETRDDPAARDDRVVPLDGPGVGPVLLIGRHPTCALTFDDPAVSRRHARVVRGDGRGGGEPGAFFLEDLGSRNSTLLGGELVTGRARLRDGDEIGICGVKLRFLADDPAAPPPPADPAPPAVGGRTGGGGTGGGGADGGGDAADEDSDDGVLDSANGMDPAMITLDDPADGPGAGALGAGALVTDALGEAPTTEEGNSESGGRVRGPGDGSRTAAIPVAGAFPGPLPGFTSPPDPFASPPDPFSSPPDPRAGARAAVVAEDDGHAPGVLAALPATRVGGYRLDVNPEAKLRAVLAISRDLAGSEGLDRVLDRTLGALFRVFPQADRAFALLADAPGEEPTIRATRARATIPGFGGADESDGASLRVSRTIVRRVMSTGEAILSSDVGDDSRFDASVSVMDLELRSIVCVPLLGRGEAAIGMLQLDTTDPTRQFSEDDLDLLRAVAVPVGLAAENARLTAEAAARREAERDLELASTIQKGFLPQSPPPADGYEFADRYESAQSVGGDYFDYVPLPGGRVAVALGDVAGKGVPAALLMARMSVAARTHLLATGGKRPTDLLAKAVRRLNAELSDGGPMGHRFITAVVLLLDTRTHTLYAVNAGHMAPLIRCADGTVEPLGEVSGGMPLGIDAGQKFQVASRTLRPGDGALVFTDGVTEAVREGAEDGVEPGPAGGPADGRALDARARNLYGRDRLAALYGRTDGPAGAVIAALSADVATWTGRGPQTDDICAVALRRTPAAD